MSLHHSDPASLLGMGQHDHPKPPVDPNADGKAPNVPPPPDPGKHGKPDPKPGK